MAVLESTFLIDALRGGSASRERLEELERSGEALAVAPVTAA
jgi:predicted nucleic acid-binding protein